MDSCALMNELTADATCNAVASSGLMSTVAELPLPPFEEYAVPPTLVVLVKVMFLLFPDYHPRIGSAFEYLA